MGTSSIKVKLLAAFVVAFICLNANGIVCVAYCQSFEIAVVEPQEHCSPKKTESPGDAVSEPAGDLDCCPMTVSFFAAPVEKNSTLSAPVIVASTPAPPRLAELALQPERSLLSAANYRGPPHRDLRDLRIRNCILRI